MIDFTLTETDKAHLDRTRQAALICRKYAREYDENEKEMPPAELPEESVLPEDDSRVEVAKLLGTARRVSLDRLLGVCGDKVAALQGRIR